MAIPLNLIGRRFGKLTVLRNGTKGRNGLTRCWCKCDCGKMVLRIASNLKTRGHFNSCDCTITHGKAWRVPEYTVWIGMRQRCYYKRHVNYKYYGGRGIKLCKRWAESFMAFYEDMGHRPKGLTIERIDNDGDYCKDNCRWATYREQRMNQCPRRNLKALHSAQKAGQP